MRALIIRTDGRFTFEKIEPGLKSMRAVIGGDIESKLLDNDGKMKMYIDEAGKIKGLPANKDATAVFSSFFRDEDYIAGDAVICGVNGNGFDCSLTRAQIKELKVRKLIGSCILDPDGMLTSKGDIEGNYETRLINEEIGFDEPFYSGQTGEDPDAPEYYGKTINVRVMQHLRKWFGNGKEKYWLGVNPETEDQWKLEIRLLSENTDRDKRLKTEAEYITKAKPISQDTANGKFHLYPTTEYGRPDLCIYPWYSQREKALKYRIKSLQNTSE